MRHRAKLLCAAAYLSASAAAAQEQVIGTWNIGGAERTAAEIGESVAALVTEIGALDLLILQEVISEEQVQAAAAALGVSHWAISDFSPPVSITNNPFGSLEVAILSRMPITRAAEWDTTGSGLTGDDFPPRASSDLIATEELDIRVPMDESVPARGFLRVDLTSGPSVYAVHWKSSLGQSCNAADIEFARQREVQAAGILHNAASILDDTGTIIVGGDFNIQVPGRALRVWVDANEDCQPSNTCEGVCGDGGTDGYDDSLASLMALEGARLLSADLPETFIGRFFPGEQSITFWSRGRMQMPSERPQHLGCQASFSRLGPPAGHRPSAGNGEQGGAAPSLAGGDPKPDIRDGGAA